MLFGWVDGLKKKRGPGREKRGRDEKKGMGRGEERV